MPTVKRIGPYLFFFYASDRDDPAHVHIEREDEVAKFWPDPVRLQRVAGFLGVEIGRIQKILMRRQGELLEAWNAYFRA
jgi:Domain of unknown function (DUF4160)